MNDHSCDARAWRYDSPPEMPQPAHRMEEGQTVEFLLADGVARYAVIGKPVETDDGSTLRLLAVPFADHPDYDETWRP